MGDVELLNRFMDEYARIYGKVWSSDPILELRRQLARATDLLRSLSPLADEPIRLGTYTTPSNYKYSLYMHKWFYLQDGRVIIASLTSPEAVIKVIKRHHKRILSSCREEIRPMAEEVIPLACELKTSLGESFYQHEISPTKRIFIVGDGQWKKYVDAIRIKREVIAPEALTVFVYDPEKGKYEWVSFPLDRGGLNTAAVLIQLEDEIMELMKKIREEVESILKHNEETIQKIKEVVAPRYMAVKLRGEEFPLDSPFEF